MKRAFVFPGQGSQSVGMGRELAVAMRAARYVFEEVDDALGDRLSRLIFEGPTEELMLTENAQPALMAVSLAVVRAIEDEGELRLSDSCAFVAGHSLGEYSALCAAGALDVAATARLLRRRGAAMQQAVPLGEGAMLALLGVDLETARAIAEEAAQGQVLAVANDNSPQQVVLSGQKEAIERAARMTAARRLGRATTLPVSAPFHCSLMAPAAELMAEALEAVTIAPPGVPLVSNVTAQPVREPARIRRLLVEQVTATVRWRECVLYLRAEEVEGIVELGAGNVLSGLVRRIDPDLKPTSVASPREVEAFLKTL